MVGIAKVATTLRLGDPDPHAGYWWSRPPAERVAHLRELQECFYGSNGAAGGRMLLGKDLRRFVSLCLHHRVRFLVVGGYAVAAHGHPRLTKDLDVWVRVDPQNAARIVDVLEEFGFESLGLAADDFTAEGQVIQLGYPPNQIDILTGIDGGDFESCWERRVEIPLDSLPVPFIGLEDLERNWLPVASRIWPTWKPSGGPARRKVPARGNQQPYTDAQSVLMGAATIRSAMG